MTRRKYTPLTNLLTLCLFITLGGFFSCGNDAPPMANAIRQRDSLPVMTTYGVSKLISDSGVIRYKIITEEWKVYDKTKPQRQTFMKGLFLEKFDEKYHVELHLTADTAYWYDQNLWELRGRVFIRNAEGSTFSTEELFWNMREHVFYSHKFMKIVEPEREIQGYNFMANEQMTKYSINNSSAVFPVGSTQSSSPAQTTKTDSLTTDSAPKREAPIPMRRGNN